MKSITTTKQELKELLEKGFFERAEPVKKGEIGLDGFVCEGINKVVQNGSWAKIYEVGDACPVKNKKGEKLWIGKKWKEIFVQTDKEVEYLKKECLIDPYSNAEPLLVRLEKIEEQKTMYINNWLETFKRVEE